MESEKIKKMTFNELRNELARCTNNPVKEKIIRSMMVLRYNQHMERKRFIQMKQAEKHQKMLMKQQQLQQSNNVNNNNNVNNDNNINNDNNVNNESEENIILDENDYDFIKPTYKSLNELDDQSNDEDFRPVREIKEQERDKLNDNLVSRLNNDMELKNNNEKNKQNKVDIVPPFSNDLGDMYAPFESIKQNKKDFSNPKFGK